jgi:hypothetical protein
MKRATILLVVFLVSACVSDPAFTQGERIAFGLTPDNVGNVQFWTVHTFQIRGGTELASDGVTAGIAGVQYRETIKIKDGTPAIVVDMPEPTSVVVDVGLVLDPLNSGGDRTETLLLGFAADENGLYTLRTVAGQSVGEAIRLGGKDYAYYTCGKGQDANKCVDTLPLGAESDPDVTLRFKAISIERESGVSGRYVTP